MGMGSSGSTGYSAISHEEITLTNDQIKASPSTPIIVVPATETLNYSGAPTQLLIPIVAIVQVAVHQADYTNIDGACAFGFSLGGGNDFVFSMRSLAGSAADLLNSAGGIGVFSAATFTGAAAELPNTALTEALDGVLLDNAIVFFSTNGGSGNFTGGHANNTLKLTVLYTTVEV